MPNPKNNYTSYKICENPSCNHEIEIKIINDESHPDYGLPIKKHRRRKTCSRECHRQWQKSITWESRVGEEFAEDFRKKMSNLSSTNNPSTFPGVAEKISKGLKNYLQDNPEARKGTNNPFFGKSHSKEQIEKWKQEKKDKWSYNEFQKQKQTQNCRRKDMHPNWLGGISKGDYGFEFNRELKKIIKENYNYICQYCGITGVPLDIHHIDYNKKNNSAENLIPLCKHCHGRTNYNRDSWYDYFTKI